MKHTSNKWNEIILTNVIRFQDQIEEEKIIESLSVKENYKIPINILLLLLIDIPNGKNTIFYCAGSNFLKLQTSCMQTQLAV